MWTLLWNYPCWLHVQALSWNVILTWPALQFSTLSNTESICQSKATRLKTSVWLLMLKGEVHPKMITSYLVVFGALSRMVKVQGACDKPFWICKRLNNCAAPAPASDDVLVVASLACPAHKNTSSSSTKTSSMAGAGAAQLFNRLYIQNGLSHAPRTFTIRHSAPNTTRYEVIIFGWTSPLMGWWENWVSNVNHVLLSRIRECKFLSSQLVVYTLISNSAWCLHVNWDTNKNC